MLTTAILLTGLFLISTVFAVSLFSMAAFTRGGFTQQAIDSDPYYYSLLRQASAQDQSRVSPPPSTLPFIPFSVQQQQQETAPEEEGTGNATGTTTATIPATNGTEGGKDVTELASLSSSSEPPLRVEAVANATTAVAPATIRLDANITGGAPPYSYSWYVPDLGIVIDQDRSITQMFFEPGTFNYILTVTDSRGKVLNDNVPIVIYDPGDVVAPEPGGIAPPSQEEEEIPLTVEIIPNATTAVAPATIEFDSEVAGGAEPYNYQWELLGGRFTLEYFEPQIVLLFPIPGMYTLVLNVTDSNGRIGSDSLQITVGGLEPPPEATGEVVSPPNGGGREGGVLLPPQTGEEGGQALGEGGGGLLPLTPLIPSFPNTTGEVVSPLIEEGGDEGASILDNATLTGERLGIREEVVAQEPGGLASTDESIEQEPGVPPPTVPGGVGGDTGGRGPQGGVTVEPTDKGLEVIPNATTGFVGDRFELYSYLREGIETQRIFYWCCEEAGFFDVFACDSSDIPPAMPGYGALACAVFWPSTAGTHEVGLIGRDSKGERISGSTQITIKGVEGRGPQGGVTAEPRAETDGAPPPPTVPEPGGVAPSEEPTEQEPGVPSPTVNGGEEGGGEATTGEEDAGGGLAVEPPEGPAVSPPTVPEGQGGEQVPPDEESTTIQPEGQLT